MTQANAFYTFQANECNPKAYDILACPAGARPPAKVGDYTVLDEGEDRSLTEKKLINLVTLLNGGSDLMDLSGIAKAKTFFRIVRESQETGQTKMVFYSNSGKGVSKENALLVVEEGVLDDEILDA